MPGLFTGEWNLLWECHGILRGLWLCTELGARCLFTQRENDSLRLCVCVGQGLRIAAYALCIINEHAERNHNGCSAPHNASVSTAGVRGHVWLCAWPLRTKTNKETFESAGGFMSTTRKQKKAVGCVTGERTVSLHTLLNFVWFKCILLNSLMCFYLDKAWHSFIIASLM